MEQLYKLLKMRYSAEFNKWMSSQPDWVREANRRWPIGYPIEIAGADHFVLGFNKSTAGEVMVIVSQVDPNVWGIENAMMLKEYVCSSHLENK